MYSGQRVLHLKPLIEKQTLTELIVNSTELNIEEANWLIAFGCCYVDRRRALTDCQLSLRNAVRVHLQPKRFVVSELSPHSVVFENSDFLIGFKPHGLPSHPTMDNYWENFRLLLAKKIKQPLLTTHQIDHLTAGLIIFAKIPSAQSKINAMFRQRKINKQYIALTQHGPPLGTLEQTLDNQLCRLTILKQQRLYDGFANLIELETGRTHQIRKQLCLLGCPIKGDPLYHEAKDGDIMHLLSYRLQFIWDEQHYSIQAPPSIMQEYNWLKELCFLDWSTVPA